MLQEGPQNSSREQLSPHLIQPSAVISHPNSSWDDLRRHQKVHERLYRLKASPSSSSSSPIGPSELTLKSRPRQKAPKVHYGIKASPSSSSSSSPISPSSEVTLRAPVRKLSRRLEPLKSGVAIRPPPPTPEHHVEFSERLCNHHEFQRQTPPEETRSQLDVIRPLKARPMPVLRRSQGVPAVGCPCCRKARQLGVLNSKV